MWLLLCFLMAGEIVVQELVRALGIVIVGVSAYLLGQEVVLLRIRRAGKFLVRHGVYHYEKV